MVGFSRPVLARLSVVDQANTVLSPEFRVASMVEVSISYDYFCTEEMWYEYLSGADR